MLSDTSNNFFKEYFDVLRTSVVRKTSGEQNYWNLVEAIFGDLPRNNSAQIFYKIPNKRLVLKSFL